MEKIETCQLLLHTPALIKSVFVSLIYLHHQYPLTCEQTYIENHIFFQAELNDFNEEIYGEYAEIILYKYLRSDIKFNSFDELKAQMGKDKREIQAYFKNIDNLNEY